MIYWPNTPGTTWELFIPNPTGYIPADGDDPQAFLTIRNNVGLWDVSGDIIFDSITPSYFRISFTISEDSDPMVPGEYTYRLTQYQDGPVLSEGVLVIGEYQSPTEQYEKTIEYEQYRAED